MVDMYGRTEEREAELTSDYSLKNANKIGLDCKVHVNIHFEYKFQVSKGGFIEPCKSLSLPLHISVYKLEFHTHTLRGSAEHCHIGHINHYA